MDFDPDFAGRVVLGWVEDTTHMDLISPQDLFKLIAEYGALKLSDVAEVGKRARGNAEEQLDRPMVGAEDTDASQIARDCNGLSGILTATATSH